MPANRLPPMSQEERTLNAYFDHLEMQGWQFLQMEDDKGNLTEDYWMIHQALEVVFELSAKDHNQAMEGFRKWLEASRWN